MKFRARLFLAILLPAVVLVSVAVAVAVIDIRGRAETAAREELGRTREAFEGALRETFDSLRRQSGPFGGTPFTAAISECVASGETGPVKELMGNEFQYLGFTPDLYELRDRKGRLLIRRSALHECAKDCVHPFQKWIADRDEALTEFDGEPFLALRIEHDHGYFVFGSHLRRTLDNLSLKYFKIGVVLTGGGRAVYSSVPAWTPGAGTEGDVVLGGARYRASSARPEKSELDLVVLLRPMTDVERLQGRALLLGAAGVALAVVVAGLVSFAVAGGISKPVEALVEATHRVGAGDYAAQVAVSGQDEMARLARAFNDMTEGLRKRRDIMEKTLSRDVADELMKGTELGGERREVTIVFLDVRGFTSGTQGVDPVEVVSMLNDMMHRLARAIDRNGGNVNKFLGDGLMAMFGAPKPLEDHAFCAVRASVEIQKEMAEWNAARTARGLPNFHTGIGVNTGAVVGGRVGSRDRLEYTLIGEEVNLTSRICGKAAPRQVLITKQTHDRVQGRVKARALEPVVVKGLSYPIAVFEVEAC